MSAEIQNYPVVLITGTSSGIGLELIKLLKRQPYRVAATSLVQSVDLVREAGFEDSDTFHLYSLDIQDYEAQRLMVEDLEKRWGRIDVIVNNAAISYRAVVEEMSEENELHQMTVNYLGPMNLTRLVLPIMRKQKSGRIINISSVGGMMAMPTMAYYSASKWAIEGASEALWFEMKPWNISVSLVRPGFINSLVFEKVFYPTEHIEGKGAYRRYYNSSFGFHMRKST